MVEIGLDFVDVVVECPTLLLSFDPSSDVEFFQPSRLKVVAFSYATACAKYKFLLIKA